MTYYEARALDAIIGLDVRDGKCVQVYPFIEVGAGGKHAVMIYDPARRAQVRLTAIEDWADWKAGRGAPSITAGAEFGY